MTTFKARFSLRPQQLIVSHHGPFYYEYFKWGQDADFSLIALRDCWFLSAAGYGFKEAPRIARSKAVSFPIPVLAPVMRTVFPSRQVVDLHTSPAAYFLHIHTQTRVIYTTQILHHQMQQTAPFKWLAAPSAVSKCYAPVKAGIVVKPGYLFTQKLA